jgi:hypothetical protein
MQNPGTDLVRGDLGSVSVGDLGPAAVAEQYAREVCEGLEVFGFAFVAADQATVVHEPGQAGLYDPAPPAELLGGLHAFAGDPHADATAADLGP